MKHKRIVKVDFFGRKWYKIFTCTGLRLVKLAPMVAAFILSSCAETTSEKSWRLYCEAYNVNAENPTESQVNYYLDCYAGSEEWEIAMMEEE